MDENKGIFGYESWGRLTTYGGSFVQALASAIRRADPQNLERLRKGFPYEVGLYEDWMGGKGA